MLQTTRVIALAVGLLILLPAMIASAEEHKSLSVQIEGEDGSSLSFSISAGLVDGLIEGLTDKEIECDGRIDADIRRMLEHLDRRGNGSKYTLKRADGQVIKGRHRDNQLILEIHEPEASDAEITLPWRVAECMLGKEVTTLSDDRLELKIEQDGLVRVRVD